MSCSFSLFNPTEFRLIAEELIKRVKVIMSKRQRRSESINKNEFKVINKIVYPTHIYYQADDKTYASNKKNIVILHRQGVSSSWGFRTWSEDEYLKV